MKKILLFLLGLAAFISFYVGCSKEPLDNLTSEESRIYITDHDSQLIFRRIKRIAFLIP